MSAQHTNIIILLLLASVLVLFSLVSTLLTAKELPQREDTGHHYPFTQRTPQQRQRAKFEYWFATGNWLSRLAIGVSITVLMWVGWLGHRKSSKVALQMALLIQKDYSVCVLAFCLSSFYAVCLTTTRNPFLSNISSAHPSHFPYTFEGIFSR